MAGFTTIDGRVLDSSDKLVSHIYHTMSEGDVISMFAKDNERCRVNIANAIHDAESLYDLLTYDVRMDLRKHYAKGIAWEILYSKRDPADWGLIDGRL